MAAFFSILFIFARLGVTAFGGPVAHLGYFRAEFVERRRWLSDASYGELVALCQFLPGPASSQVGMGIGYLRGGWWGALAAWLGFTLPGATAMVLLAYGVWAAEALASQWQGLLLGVKAVAVAVVAQALWGMARALCPDRLRALLAVGAALVATVLPSTAGQLLAIAVGALVGLWRCPAAAQEEGQTMAAPSRTVGLLLLLAFALLLALLPLLAALVSHPAAALGDGFYRVGALVFGGGHVVLPLLQTEIIAPQQIDPEAFIAGYGLIQGLPGPLFNLSPFIGATSAMESGGLWPVGLAVIALGAIFLPGALLLFGALPFWARLRQWAAARRALAGVNAAVVGLLGAAFYQPVWTLGVVDRYSFMIALAAWGALALGRWPPWLVVLVGGGVGIVTTL